MDERDSRSLDLPRNQGAFVIQFRAVADVEDSRFTGRAEHIASGQILNFETLEALAQFMRRLLSEGY